MSFYIGPFYIDKRDGFIVLAAILIILGMRWGYELVYFRQEYVLSLFILLLLAKATILPTHDSWVFIAFLLAMLGTLFLPFLQVLIGLALFFIFLRLFKVI